MSSEGDKRSRCGSTPDIESSLNKLNKIPRRFFVRHFMDHGRTFPWREKGVDPFAVLIVEMLLRQTSAGMVAGVWPRFMELYPTPLACVEANEQEMIAVLRQLGLSKQRTRAIRLMSQALLIEHEGRVPRDVDPLLALPHVGLYAANATACFAFGHKVPVIDSNVRRVLVRFTSVKVSEDVRRGKTVQLMASHLLPRRSVREHNYGLLDFCAQVCKPRVPVCETCLLASACDTGKMRRRAGLLKGKVARR